MFRTVTESLLARAGDGVVVQSQYPFRDSEPAVRRAVTAGGIRINTYENEADAISWSGWAPEFVGDTGTRRCLSSNVLRGRVCVDKQGAVSSSPITLASLATTKASPARSRSRGRARSGFRRRRRFRL